MCIGMVSPVAETLRKDDKVPPVPDAACFGVTAQSPCRSNTTGDGCTSDDPRFSNARAVQQLEEANSRHC